MTVTADPARRDLSANLLLTSAGASVSGDGLVEEVVVRTSESFSITLTRPILGTSVNSPLGSDYDDDEEEEYFYDDDDEDEDDFDDDFDDEEEEDDEEEDEDDDI